MAGTKKQWVGPLVGLAIATIGVGLALRATRSDRSRPDRFHASATDRGTAQDLPGDSVLRIGVLYWSSTIEGQVAMRQGLEAEAQRINAGPPPHIELIPKVAGDGADGRERQIAQMRTMVADNLHAIILQPTDNAALSEPLMMANRAGIPVVAYDQYVEEGHLAAYITSDNRQAGALDGEYIAHRFDDARELKIVLVEYPHVSSTVERLDGFLSTLKLQNQAFRIVGTYKAVEPVAGKAAGHKILEDFPQPGDVDVVFTVNDGGGISVVEVLAEAGRDEIIVATIDGDPRSVENVRQGRLTVIDSAQFCGPIGAAALKAAYTVAQGGSTPALQLIPTFPITKETLERYPGWMGPLPPAFTKPWQSQQPIWKPTAGQVAAP